MAVHNRPARRVTQADIAARLGISRATVSAALSGARFVSPELKEQILRTIDELHYVPDIVARSMKTNRTMTLGLVMPNILSPVWATVARGVADVARQAGFSTIIYDTDEQEDAMCAALRTLQEKRVDGILLAPSAASGDSLPRYLGRLEMPVVLVDRGLPDVELDSVVSDGEGGIHKAVSHFLETGRRRIALINLPLEITTGAERQRGYLRALAEADVAYDERLVRTGGHGAEDGHRAMLDLLDQPRERRPDAVVAASHLLTVGTLMGLRQKKLRVPDDLAVIGFDDTAWAPLLDPPLTVIIQSAYEMGAEATRLLVGRVNEDEAARGEARHVVLPTALGHRASCCRAGASSADAAELRGEMQTGPR